MPMTMAVMNATVAAEAYAWVDPNMVSTTRQDSDGTVPQPAPEASMIP